jgi:hypothetical protein
MSSALKTLKTMNFRSNLVSMTSDRGFLPKLQAKSLNLEILGLIFAQTIKNLEISALLTLKPSKERPLAKMAS